MSRSRLLAIVAIAVVAVAVGGFIVYDQVLRGDSIAALSLPSAAPTTVASSATSTPSAASSTVPAATASTAAGSTDGAVAGTWTVPAGSSQAGYRVREQLANLPAESDAVGRTDQVTGSITLETNGSATSLTAGTITVDTTSITSDESRRDNRLRSEGLETDTYPTATFTLTQPVEVPAAALAGTPSDLTLVGDLELHGVKKSVSIPAQAQLVDGTIQVAGSLSFPLSDFGITAPNIGGFIVSIADEGTLEFLVSFTKG
jgi:polyisoprenoid-binding protein YceI